MMNLFLKILKYSLLIMFIIFILLFLLFYYVNKQGGEHFIKEKDLMGISDNNPYGIRNEVYLKSLDILERESKKDPDFKNEKFKNLYFNFIKSQLVAMKYFSDKPKTSESINQSVMIQMCFYHYEKKDFISRQITHYKNESEIDRNMFNSNDRHLAFTLANQGNKYDINNDKRRPGLNPWICPKYMEKVLDENDFISIDPRILQ